MKPLAAFVLPLFFLMPFVSFSQSSCSDTSFRIRYLTPAGSFLVRDQIISADNGTIMLGLFGNLTSQTSKIAVIKIDNIGKVIWSKQLSNSNYISATKIIELRNGDLVFGGYITFSSSVRKIFLARLTATGDIIWNKYYDCNNFNPEDQLDLYTIAEGCAGNILPIWRGLHLQGTFPNDYDSSYAIISKLDNNGNQIWTKGFISNDGNLTVPAGLYVENGVISMYGAVNDNGGCDHTFWAMKLDCNSGELQTLKSYCYSEMQSNEWLVAALPRINFETARLLNSNIALFGRFYAVTPSSTYCYKVVFDKNLELNTSVIYSLPRNTTSQIFVQPDGKSNIYIRKGQSDCWSIIDKDDKIERQRQIPFSNDLQRGGYIHYNFKSPGYITFTTNYFDSNQFPYIEHTQLQENDPSLDDCFGKDTSFVNVLPFPVTPSNWTWKYIVDIPMTTNDLNFTTTDFPLQQENVCKLMSRCDSLHIKGPDTICIAQNVLFTGIKNPECKKRVLWAFDSSAVYSSNQLDDSTLQLNFKLPTDGVQTLSLYASAANCTVAKDTMLVTLVSGMKHLPSDTTICSGSTLRLSPGNWFRSYLWQDSSTESVFTVTGPGTYYVRVETSCGNYLSDTIRVHQPMLALGSDLVKCNKDTLVIKATSGLLNYNWSPLNSLLFVSDSIVKVYPDNTINYIASAHSIEGCIVKDTVRIIVNHSPVINLGRDTSFCNGDSLVLNAGTGFTNYLWNTGAVTQAIAARDKGSYIVHATDFNNCSSTDTLNVINVYPAPAVNIHVSQVLCRGQNDILNAGAGYTSYLWQDGSTGSTNKVNASGSYWVHVTDANGCSNSDSVMIVAVADPPLNFIYSDTSKCPYETIILTPQYYFTSYLWSDGSIASSLAVQQPGIYSLQVTDTNGCSGFEKINVAKKDCPNAIYFPSAFTPNKDGRNEIFKPYVQGLLTKFKLEIYNRWGQKVFESTDPGMGWNGCVGRRLQPAGVFVWYSTYQFANDKENSMKGTALIIR